MAIIARSGRQVQIEWVDDQTFYVVGEYVDQNDRRSISGPFSVNDPRFIIAND